MTIPKSKTLAWTLFVVYFLMLTKLVLLKNPSLFLSHLLHWSSENFEQGKKHLVMVPFQTTWTCLSGERGFEEGFENLAGNLFGFVPMGFLLPILFTALTNGKKVVAIVFATSLSFELLQLFTGVGYCDIDDIIQNTLGGLLGYWIYKKWAHHIH